MILTSHTILYVDDQQKSTAFYATVLDKAPRLNVPGMTEFALSPDAVLGLMPKPDILSLLGDNLSDTEIPEGGLRAELYLLVDQPEAYHQRALSMGARNLSDLTDRTWGHRAAYCLDPDGYVLAFASDLTPSKRTE